MPRSCQPSVDESRILAWWSHANISTLLKELLSRVESECTKVGLRLNPKKTKVITHYIKSEHSPLTTIEDSALKEVKDFKYPGSWVNSSEQDLKGRKSLAWKEMNGMASV